MIKPGESQTAIGDTRTSCFQLLWRANLLNRNPWVVGFAILLAAGLIGIAFWHFWSVNKYWKQFEALNPIDVGTVKIHKEEEVVTVNPSLAREIFIAFQESPRTDLRCNSYESYQTTVSVNEKMYFAELRFTKNDEMVANFSSDFGEGWHFGQKKMPSETAGKIRSLFMKNESNQK